MRIAVTTENGAVFQHFGKCELFTLYDVDLGGKIGKMSLPTGGKGHSELAGLLHVNSVELLLCGGIGQGAIEALSALGIRTMSGTSGETDEVVSRYLAGTLEGGSKANCDHHSGEHGEGHVCTCHSH